MDISDRENTMDVIVKEKYFDDSSLGEDYLNMNIYADALSEIIKNKNNINIGIYAEWGQGKSFLMNLLKNKLKLSKKEKEDIYVEEASCFFCGLNNNVTKCFFNCFYNNFELNNKDRTCNCFNFSICHDIEMGSRELKKKCFHFGIENENENCFLKYFKGIFGGMCQTSEEYVIIDFNAWIYEGSDNLWAGLIERLHIRMEDHFGWLRIRWFRLFDYEYPTFKDKFGLLISYIFYVGIPCLFGIIFWYIFDAYNEEYASDLSIIIGSTGSGIYIFSKFIKTLLELSKSQAEEIIKNSNKTQEKLGFMNEVKKEVEIISQFLKYNDKRVVIFIDDLDRCKYNKAVDVLNSVMLLLSEKDSRFITFFAIDPRIVIKSIESTYSESLLNAGINGFEYLDKIIQIPFVLSQKVLSKNHKKIFIKNLIEIDHNTDILNKLEIFIDKFFVPIEMQENLNMEIINQIINTGNSFAEIEKIYSEKMKKYDSLTNENYISLKQKYMTYDVKYNLNLLKYLNDNKKFCEEINGKKKKNLFSTNYNCLVNNIICILKSSGSLDERDLDILIINLFYIKKKIKEVRKEQKIDNIIKIFKDYYDKVINKIFFVRIDKENIIRKFIDKFKNLENYKCNFFESNYNNILELIIKEDENLDYFDQESKNKSIILELILYIHNVSTNTHFLKKFLPYKMIMITINNEEFEDQFIKKYINFYLSKEKKNIKITKIQLKANNIKCEIFPKIREYDNILQRYFQSNYKIDMFSRLKYLKKKDEYLLNKDIFFEKYYNNNVTRNDDNVFIKLNEISPNLIITEQDEIDILNTIHDHSNSYNIDDNFLNYKINNDIFFKINYLFKEYIPSYYDYMKDTFSQNSIEVDNYKLKNWYLLRNDYEGECLKYIIYSENLFYKYLSTYSKDEMINDKNYEFTLRRPLLIFPFFKKTDDSYHFYNNLTNLSINTNKKLQNSKIYGYYEKEINEKKSLDNFNNKCLIDYLKENIKTVYDNCNQDIQSVSKQNKENIKNNILCIVPNVSYSKIHNKEKLFTNIDSEMILNEKINYQNCYIINKKHDIEENKFYELENDKYLIDQLDKYYNISEKIKNIDYKNTNNITYQSNNIIDSFIFLKFKDLIDYKFDIKPNIIYKSIYRNYINENEKNTVLQQNNAFNLFIQIKNKQHLRNKLLFDNYVNNQEIEKDASLIKDYQGRSIGEVSIINGRKRKFINDKIITINTELDIFYKEFELEINKILWKEKEIEILKKEFDSFFKKNISELDGLIIDCDFLNKKMEIKKEYYEYYNKLKIMHPDNEMIRNLLNFKNTNGNMFDYLVFYNCIDKIFLFINDLKMSDYSDKGFFIKKETKTENIDIEQINENCFSDKKYGINANIDINDINFCSMGINIFKYDKLMSILTENFDNEKDKSLYFMNKDTYKKLLLKELIKNEGWGYDKNYYDETLYLKNKKSFFKNVSEVYENYPPEILHNCINLYYDYLNSKNRHIFTNIKDNNVYKKIIFEICMHNKIDIKESNVKFNNKDIHTQQNILKDLDNIYKNYNDKKKSGFIIDKESIQFFSKYLIDYRKDIEGNIIGGSSYDYIRDCNFHLLTRIKDEKNNLDDNLLLHPFSIDDNILYFLKKVTIRNAIKIIKETLMKIDKNLLDNVFYSYRDLYILYTDLEVLIKYSLDNPDFFHFFDTSYNDYSNKDHIFDMPYDYNVKVNSENIDILYELIRDYPIYNFYIEFKHFIFNLCKNTNIKFTEKYKYEINKNEWFSVKKNDQTYFLHKDSNKIYKNIYPSSGLQIFSINDIYNVEIIDIFTNILYGYNFSYLKELDQFQLYMWDQRRDFNNRIYNDNTIEISMTQEELDLIYTCLDFLKPNPRKIKRILNIISLTRYIINNSPFLLKDISFEQNLIYRCIIKFTILYEQWPYRTTWLSIWIKECYELNDNNDYNNFNTGKLKSKWLPEKLTKYIKKNSTKYKDKQINHFLKNTSLDDMYYYIEEYIFSTDKLVNLSKMDCDPDLFCQFLRLDICDINENRQCLKHCLDMIEIEKINFNYNPAILATCVTEINKLQINMKYKGKFCNKTKLKNNKLQNYFKDNIIDPQILSDNLEYCNKEKNSNNIKMNIKKNNIF